MQTAPTTLKPESLTRFREDGFVLLQQLVSPDTVASILSLSEEMNLRLEPPIEFEAELGYPGAPESPSGPGGKTVRRFKRVVERDPVFKNLATAGSLVGAVEELLASDVVLSLSHHNCLMLKDPKFSSDTGWHQDIRYWRFERPELVTVVIALNTADESNGCLRLIPGSHTAAIGPTDLDDEQFLREDLPHNRALIAQAVDVPMEAGDVVIFHCKAFHAASRNRGGETRKSVLFTYRPASNRPIPGTRSDGDEVVL